MKVNYLRHCREVGIIFLYFFRFIISIYRLSYCKLYFFILGYFFHRFTNFIFWGGNIEALTLFKCWVKLLVPVFPLLS